MDALMINQMSANKSIFRVSLSSLYIISDYTGIRKEPTFYSKVMGLEYSYESISCFKSNFNEEVHFSRG